MCTPRMKLTNPPRELMKNNGTEPSNGKDKPINPRFYSVVPFRYADPRVGCAAIRKYERSIHLFTELGNGFV